MSAPTALYRRYRPDSFATVIGQEHVTAPLMTALDKNRVNHAYLFSGPRGCGKTTSARILARCLNCAKGPTSHPCGECDSCVELARGGAGSLDVIEIDAASHGGVDDARDLRERATFAPIRDRYKIFIIDEAHMVTSAGFNALLKIVEEPPEHIKFIFATTEPDKVIGTIRSRTHHYPFRLVPPEPLMAYLAQLCEQENVAVAPGVLSLVVRAGGGSVRDSLSVLDQLMAGAAATGLDYDLAVDLLGYTHSSLLDDIVEALAASDSATVFKSVDRVIQTGHDPRRFVEDLLERFRDLIIVQAMPESAHAILRGTPDELIARMQTQAAQLGAAELSRAADITNAAFNEMTGATSPRLHLELLGARLLLPGADASSRGMATRLDQLERRINYAGTPLAAPSAEAPAAVPAQGMPSQNFPGPSAAPDSYDSAPLASGSAGSGGDAGSGGGVSSGGGASGGLAAVRAQLARAKEAAGAEVAARQTHDASPATAQVAPAAQPSAASSTPQTAQSAQAVQPVQSAPAAPHVETTQQGQPVQPVQFADTAQPADTASQQQVPRPARTWDDLPTPTGDAAFVAQQHDAPAASTTTDAAPSQTQPQAQPNQPEPTQSSPPVAAATTGGAPAAGTSAGTSAGGTSGIEVIRRAWPEIIGALRNIRMASWVIVNQNVVPQTFDGQELRVGLPSTGLIAAFSNGGHLANLQQAINQVLGLSVQILPVDGEAPKASSEPNPKVQTGNPSPQGGGPGNNATPKAESVTGQGQMTAPAQAAPAPVSAQPQAQVQTQRPASSPASASAPIQASVQPAAPAAVQASAPSSAPVQAPAQAAAPVQAQNWQQGAPSQGQPAAAVLHDSWGLPVEPVSTPAPEAPSPGPATQQQAAPSSAAVSSSESAATTAPTAAVPSPAVTSAMESAPWDGPLEPSDPWDEPHAEFVPPADPYDSGSAYPPEDSYLPSDATPATSPASAPAPAYTPPKISPIAAWTTGWDTPAVQEPVAAPALPETPRRSELLAQQVAQQSTQQAPADSAQDWGVSLGQTRRSDVADPGWGDVSAAPDWAQPGTADSGTAGPIDSESSPAGSGTAHSTAPLSPAPTAEPAAPAASPEPTPAPVSTVAQAPRPASQGEPSVTAPAQEDPASNGPEAGEKLSMYQRLANSPAAQAARVQTPAAAANTPYVEDVPGPDDVTIEESGVVGQAAVERILGGVLIEERPLNNSH